MLNTLTLSGMCAYTETGVIDNAEVIIHSGKIHSIQKNTKKKIFPENYYLLPGFIDLHVHGVKGSDVMDATPDALAVISQALAAEGTTSFLATTMTASNQDIEKALSCVSNFMRDQNHGANLLGVHLEGPFLSAKKVGAQRLDLIQNPDVNLISHWQTLFNHVIKLVTLAPELKNSEAFIHYLVQQKIIASIGHTDATYDETKCAIKAGCSHATHLFNAMRGLHQREPGALGAILESDNVSAELILDGEHLHPAMVNLAVKIKGLEKLILITDSMRAKGLPDGEYDLGGQTVHVKNNRACLYDGTLAGSVLKMPQALKHFMEQTKCNLAQAIKLATENPAKKLGIFANKGSIALGKDADLVVLDDAFNVVMTVVRGEIAFQLNV